MKRPSRLTDAQVIRALNYNESLREPERDDDSDVLSLFNDIDDIDESDEVMDYMVELLEAGEIDFDSFQYQMRSAGYGERDILRAAEMVS